MEYLKARQEIIKACLWLQENNLVLGTWGNVSVRIDDCKIMVTPSKVSYDVLKPADMVIVGMDGKKIDGYNSPTSEMDVHRLIYCARKDIGAVVHCHPVHASAMCVTGEGIPPILEEMTQMIGGEIPSTTQYIRAGDHIELAEEAVACLGDKNAVLLRNHAPVCCGRDLQEALTCSKLVEKAAACYMSLKGKFNINVIPEDMVKAERDRFLYKYGHEL
jgi:L-fuculose-phosphate aldolase